MYYTHIHTCVLHFYLVFVMSLPDHGALCILLEDIWFEGCEVFLNHKNYSFKSLAYKLFPLIKLVNLFGCVMWLVASLDGRMGKLNYAC